MKTRQGKPAAENTFIIFQRDSCSCGSDPFINQSSKQAIIGLQRPKHMASESSSQAATKE